MMHITTYIVLQVLLCMGRVFEIFWCGSVGKVHHNITTASASTRKRAMSLCEILSLSPRPTRAIELIEIEKKFSDKNTGEMVNSGTSPKRKYRYFVPMAHQGKSKIASKRAGKINWVPRFTGKTRI